MTTAPQQLDIFAHSRDVMLRNDALQAVERRDAVGARIAWRALAAVFDADQALAPLDVLTRVLEQRSDSPLPDAASVAREVDAVLNQIAVAARQGLGIQAGELWLRPLWAELAARCKHLAFDAGHADNHAAALWLRAGQWEAAIQAVERIESWRRIPAPLSWMAEARCRLGGIDESWPLLAELGWLAPARLRALFGRVRDPLLTRLHERFEAEFDGERAGDGSEWFVAWVLTQTPALAPRLALAQPSLHGASEQGMRLLIELLGLERQGRHHDLIRRRRDLRELHAPLYAAYMATR